jgi:hypothetical protein
MPVSRVASSGLDEPEDSKCQANDYGCSYESGGENVVHSSPNPPIGRLRRIKVKVRPAAPRKPDVDLKTSPQP